MIAKYSKMLNGYKITLNRQEAVKVASSGTQYTALAEAIESWTGLDEFVIYGSKVAIQAILCNA